MPRQYVTDLPGGTATTSLQMQGNATLKRATLSFLSTAVGKIELSRSPTSQIGTAQPTEDVAFRLNTSATAGNVVVTVEFSFPVKAFQTIYIHQTGVGNLGTINLY